MPLTLIVLLLVLVVFALVGAAGYVIDRSVDSDETEKRKEEEERSR
jgi:flagellar basal body-associated protein FliL